MDQKDVCAVILAGGKSTRMGCNKALLNIKGKPLIQMLIERVRPVTEKILISSNDPFTYHFLNYPVIRDRFRNHGPLAGVHAAMVEEVSSLYLVLACDLPNLSSQLLRRLVHLGKDFDAVIPRTRDGVKHPLCAVYRRTCLPAIEAALTSGANTVMLMLFDHDLAVKWVDPEEGQFEDTDLANLNTPEDLRRLGISPGP